jgi:hypothetical protein
MCQDLDSPIFDVLLYAHLGHWLDPTASDSSSDALVYIPPAVQIILANHQFTSTTNCTIVLRNGVKRTIHRHDESGSKDRVIGVVDEW